VTQRASAEALAQALEIEAAVLRELAATLRAHRGAFVSLRGGSIATGADAVAGLTHRALAAARQREAVLAELAGALALRGQPRISALLPRLPADVRPRLSAAADAARAAAHACGLECRTGSRLLDLSQRCLRALLPGIGAEHGARVYDQRARMQRTGAATGSFVRGVI
jgi:hypothetical protein